MARDINRFRTLRRKRQNYLNHLAFLVKCKREKLIPRFINVHCNLRPSRRISRAIQNFKLSLLRSVIQDTRSKLASIERELFDIHLNIANNSSKKKFRRIDSISKLITEKISKRHKLSLANKFNKLKQKKSPKIPNLPNVNKNAVVNLSSFPLSDSPKNVLKYNFYFVKSTKASFKNLIAPIEKAFKFSKISETQKDSLRHLIAHNANFNSNISQPNLKKRRKKCSARN